jgi:glutamate dehydrogenase
VRQIARNIGEFTDVPAPDVMTTPQHMIWMLDEYETIMGRSHHPGMITGKPVGMGGSLGRKEATGYGVVYTIREALKGLGMKPEGTTASVQGFGNVSQYAIQLYTQLGGRVVAVSSWDANDKQAYTFRRESGVNFDELLGITDKFGTIDKAKAKGLGFEQLAGDAWLEQDVDILIPAALENQVRGDNAGKIGQKVRILAEGANGPTTPEADEILKQRGIFVIPDFLANAGGVTCSYFEQVQSNMNYYWDRDEVLSKLDMKMTSAFHAVNDVSTRQKIFMRDAAYVVAINRVASACRDRGWV